MNPTSTPRYTDRALLSALIYFNLSHPACQGRDFSKTDQRLGGPPMDIGGFGSALRSCVCTDAKEETAHALHLRSPSQATSLRLSDHSDHKPDRRLRAVHPR